jgi:hypothetical protein
VRRDSGWDIDEMSETRAEWGALNIALPESPVRIDMMMDTNCSDSLRIRHTQRNEVRGIF